MEAIDEMRSKENGENGRFNPMLSFGGSADPCLLCWMAKVLKAMQSWPPSARDCGDFEFYAND
jgi:hypothetical protein